MTSRRFKFEEITGINMYLSIVYVQKQMCPFKEMYLNVEVNASVKFNVRIECSPFANPKTFTSNFLKYDILKSYSYGTFHVGVFYIYRVIKKKSQIFEGICICRF